MGAVAVSAGVAARNPVRSLACGCIVDYNVGTSAEFANALTSIAANAGGNDIIIFTASFAINESTPLAIIQKNAEFKLVVDVNLIAPVYWALEMIGRVAEDRAARGLKRWTAEEGMQGSVVFIGSISSQGNRGQISYASTKAGLEGAAATIMKEAIFHGVRCGVIHPGFTDTPMVRQMGMDYVAKNILPYTQLGRLIRPEEIADAICFMLANSAVSGELWVDAGWHAPA